LPPALTELFDLVKSTSLNLKPMMNIEIKKPYDERANKDYDMDKCIENLL